MTTHDDHGMSDLFSGAVSAGVISAKTSSLLTGHLGQVVIAGAAGQDLDDIMATDVTLITLLIDASTSIGQASLEPAVRAGQRAMLDAFSGSRQSDEILVSLWIFDSEQKCKHSYVPVADATRLDGRNYRSSGCTVLYDAWCDALAANVAYAQRLRDGGTPCRSIVVVITDGEDCGSARSAADCKRVSKDLLASEQFVLAFVGVGDEAEFRKIARRMGIPKACVLVQQHATPGAMRQAFDLVSQSAIRVSQGLVQPGPNAGFFQP